MNVMKPNDTTTQGAVAVEELPGAITTPEPAPHPHRMLDRATGGILARMTAGLSPHSVFAAWSDWALHLSRSPGRQLELIERAQINAVKLVGQTLAGGAEPFKPRVHDHRFVDPSWNALPFSAFKQSFLAMQDWWDAATEDMPGLARGDADRTKFQARQALDLISPSNFPWSNPEILQRTADTGGQNLIDGARNLAQDVVQTLTQARKPPPEGFTIGKHLACTPGEVVFRNDLFELIQYAPQTERVRPEPVLFVPAWIMKYYILDLSAHNSMVNYLVRQGFTVFMISWCNPTAEQSHLSLDDYRQRGVMAALEVINQIVPAARVHVNGYCLGGTLMAITAAVMARDGDDRLASLTLMAAQVDFAEAGELLLFVDDSQVAFIEDLMWTQGYLDRPQMAQTFASIRAEDLIYSRAVNRYFLGRPDLPSDLLVWNGDTTRMPARMHSQYLRALFMENRLSAGRFAVEGRVIALKDIAVPLFVVATETDHVAPWRSVYKTRLFTKSELTFVLTRGGHNGGIVSEPGHRRRHYRIGHLPAGALYTGPDAWLADHQPVAGSWWLEMATWLADRSAEPASPPSMGRQDRYGPDLGRAPGSYVHQL